MAFFKNGGNVWLVKTHYYDDGEQFYDTAKARYESVLDTLNQGTNDTKGSKNTPKILISMTK